MCGRCAIIQVLRTDGNWYTAEYSQFHISNEADKYRLSVSGYSGDAGDAMASENIDESYRADGMQFSTADSDNDGTSSHNCAALRDHGWWFNGCFSASDLNSDLFRSSWSPGFPDVLESRMWIHTGALKAVVTTTIRLRFDAVRLQFTALRPFDDIRCDRRH